MGLVALPAPALVPLTSRGVGLAGELPPVLLVHLPGTTALRLRVLTVGLACCAVEAVIAAVRSGRGTYTGESTEGGSPAVEVLVVSGTVTDKLAPLVQRLHAMLPPPVRVVSFGACANSGGPYWDSYCVTPGVDTLLPVDVYVPGCPPRPEALLAALRELSA